MLKKFIVIIFILFFIIPAIAGENNQDFYVGTPRGFYDDINPDDLESDEKSVALYANAWLSVNIMNAANNTTTFFI